MRHHPAPGSGTAGCSGTGSLLAPAGLADANWAGSAAPQEQGRVRIARSLLADVLTRDPAARSTSEVAAVDQELGLEDRMIDAAEQRLG